MDAKALARSITLYGPNALARGDVAWIPAVREHVESSDCVRENQLRQANGLGGQTRVWNNSGCRPLFHRAARMSAGSIDQAFSERFL